MKHVKRALALVPALTLWLMFSVLLWGFVFSRITETTPDKKLVLCVDAQTPRAVDLAVALEKEVPENIRMVQVRPFSYAMFSGDVLVNADLLIVKASDAETYRDWFAPLPEEMREEGPVLSMDGIPYGLLVYDASTGRGAAMEYIEYRASDGTQENCYLFFGARSAHLPGNENAVDDAALGFARAVLQK